MSASFVYRIGHRPTVPNSIRCTRWSASSRRYFGSGGSTQNPRPQPPRKERRIQERLGTKQSGSTPSDAGVPAVLAAQSSPTLEAQHRVLLATYHRIRQRARDLRRDLAPDSPVVKKLQAALYRLPLALVLWMLVTSEDTAPFKASAVEGASMLPSLAAQGDIVINETGAWSRMLGIATQYRIGDIIVWREPRTRKAMSVKRIIGLEGDTVQRFGEHVQMYKDDPNWGITDDPSMHDYDPDGEPDMTRTVVIPPGHVWVEGDNPPFSKDSRHYGPLPNEWLRGRIVARIWPPGAPQLSRERPGPVPMEELVADPQFNVHNLGSSSQSSHAEQEQRHEQKQKQKQMA